MSNATVPVEPTDEMIDAGQREYIAKEFTSYEAVHRIWQAMLSASPVQPVEAVSERDEIIEMCAARCDYYAMYVTGPVSDGVAKELAADIRILKSKPTAQSAQPVEQEAVAWMADPYGKYPYCATSKTNVMQWAGKSGVEIVPLYAAPLAAREPVQQSVEEMVEIIFNNCGGYRAEGATVGNLLHRAGYRLTKATTGEKG